MTSMEISSPVVSDLAAELKCAVCLEFFTEPQALQCLHTFCKGCIQPLLKFRKLECPTCRTVSLEGNVVEDFRTKRLLEIYNQVGDPDFKAPTSARSFLGKGKLGTINKFTPPCSYDTSLISGVNTTVSTKHQCITAMSCYNTKSLEELRVEDYSEGRGIGQNCTQQQAAASQANTLSVFEQNQQRLGKFGTMKEFSPVSGVDTPYQDNVDMELMWPGPNSTFSHTWHQCITGMREYQDKSLEELRYEDYVFNRKGPSQTQDPFQTALSGGQSLGPSPFRPNRMSQHLVGTPIRFVPPEGREEVMKNGVNRVRRTKHQCITGMDEYKYKSLEELRFEDYTVRSQLP